MWILIETESDIEIYGKGPAPSLYTVLGDSNGKPFYTSNCSTASKKLLPEYTLYSERGQSNICIGQEVLITTSSALYYLASQYTACTQAVHS